MADECYPFFSEGVDDIQQAHRGTDECVFAMAKKSESQTLMMEHEICHLYGAVDYYSGGSITDAEAQFCQKNFYDDIMNCKYDGPCRIGPATAYLIGWADKLDSRIFNNAFQSLKIS